MANLTREMKDISFNNSFGFRPMAGTCEKCAFGRGVHSESCVRVERVRRILAPLGRSELCIADQFREGLRGDTSSPKFDYVMGRSTSDRRVV